MTKSFSKFRPRILFLTSAVILMWTGLTMRFFYIQVVLGRDLQELGKKQGEDKVILAPVRGTIYDRQHVPLAENILHHSFAIHPQQVENREVLISEFSRVTGHSRDYYQPMFDSDRGFVYLERNLKNDMSQPLLKLKDRGLVVHHHGYRSYPHRSISAHIIGFTNVDNVGLEGIERQFDKHLRGREGWIILQTDGKGRSERNPGYPRQEPVDGSDLYLTIDLEYQAILQDELSRRIVQTEAKGAMGIILEPRTGRILAMASVPGYDPNNPLAYPKENYRNRVIADQFEPGSTFKIVAAVAALSLDRVGLQEEFNCEDGSYDFRGTVIRDWSDFGLLTFPQIIENSSNVGVIKITERVGSKQLFLFARKLGFGAPTGICLPGESRGVLKPPEEWSRISMAEIALGHEVSVSTLQLAFAYASIANGGYLMKPILVDEIIHPSGQILYKAYPQVVRRIADREDMAMLTDMLRRVVVSGTGTSANIAGWNVAGKTGTAQKYIDGAYSSSKFISSFVGFFPADDPLLVAALILDEPKPGYHWGGVGAAPMFKEIMKRIINIDDEILVHRSQRGKALQQVELASGGVFEPASHNDPIGLMTAASIAHSGEEEGTIMVPNVRGMSLRAAVATLRRSGLKANVLGSGAVVWQAPGPGAPAKKNTACTIRLQ